MARAIAYVSRKRGLIRNLNPFTNRLQWSRRSSLAGDHVLPREGVKEAIAAARLKGVKISKDQYRRIAKELNGPGNLRPMLKLANSSKGARNPIEWVRTLMGRKVAKRYLRNMGTIQRNTADKINEIINKGPGGRDWP